MVQQTAEQKWQQEMLQREAQQLQQQMERNWRRTVSRASRESRASRGSKASRATGNRGQGTRALRHRDRHRLGQAGGRRECGQAIRGQSAAASGRQPATGCTAGARTLAQANDDMKRAGSQSASAADSRRAADRLREATDLLGGRPAAGRRRTPELHGADGRATGEPAEAAGGSCARPDRASRTRHTRQASSRRVLGAGNRQDDQRSPEGDRRPGRLTQQLRAAARELAPTQPAASTKLRGALDGMDESDLGTRLQRSSDWLRSGDFSDPVETALTNDLQKLGQQVSDAARALGGCAAYV